MTKKKLTARHYFPGLVKKEVFHDVLKTLFFEIMEKIERDVSYVEECREHGEKNCYNPTVYQIEDLRKIAFLCIRGDSCFVGIVKEIFQYLSGLEETPPNDKDFDLYEKDIKAKHSFMKELRKVLTDWGQGDFPDNPEETQNGEEE